MAGRALITGMLRHIQPDTARTDLRRVAGWLSALLGNLAFHLSDYPAAWIHLGTAARLGADVGDAHLVCWSLVRRAWSPATSTATPKHSTSPARAWST
jgi:hypothetical protein